MVTSQVPSESLGRPPSVGSWLLTGEELRVSHGKEEKVYPGRCTLHRQSGPSQEVRASKVWGCRLFVVVELLSCAWTAALEASLPFTVSRSSLRLMSVELMMPSSHLVLCCRLFLLSSVFPSIRVFFNELALCIRWPNYWSFSFSVNPFSEYLGLISFRIDVLDLLAVQGTVKWW